MKLVAGVWQKKASQFVRQIDISNIEIAYI